MSTPISNDFGSSSPPASSTGAAQFVKPVSKATAETDQARDEAKGATYHSVDSTPPPPPPPSAAAQEQSRKAALAAVAPVDTSALPSLRGPVLKEFKQAGGGELVSDVGDKGKMTETTAGLGEADALAIQKKEGRLDEDGVVSPPGAIPPADEKAGVREIPSWFAIGWTGQDKTLFESPSEVRARSILSDFLSDAYYGQWWHNAGIIVFAVVGSHFVTLFGGGWAWLIIILAFSATYYQTSIRRTRRNARDDLTREVAKKGLKADVESATWLNLFMQRFWLIYEPVLSATIVASVDQVLSVSTPGFLDSIRMTTFTLGTKPPHIDHVRTFPDTEEDVVMMEWAISFTPNDLQDLTYAEAARKVNPKIVLNIRIGVGPAVVGKDIIVEDLSFKGVMRIKLKLMNNFPHVQLVDLSFNQPPEFDFVLKPVGFDLSIIPGLSPFITSQVHGILGPMMYAPNTFTLNLEQMLSGAPIDTACGVLAITIYNGRNLKGTKIGGGAPDPYVTLSIAGRAELARTHTKNNTSSPHWNETKFLLLNNINEVLTLNVKDWNDHRPDSDLGTVNFDMKSLAEDGQQENIFGEVVLEGKPRGTVRFDAIYYPVLTPKKLADGTEEPIPETKCGVVRLVIHQAKELDPQGARINPMFIVKLNDKQIHRSQTLKRTPQPIWERPCEFLVTEKSTAVVGVHIFDDNSLVSDMSLGFVKIKLTDILEANAKQQDWFPLSQAKSGRVRISAEWKPVLMAGAINGAGAYTPPIGVVRLWFKRGVDLKNLETFTGGKSDPYVRVMHGGIVVARTRIIDDDLNPVWDEFVYVEVHNPRDQFVLEVMDYQNVTKDRSLGQADLRVKDLLVEGTDKKLRPWLSTGKHERVEKLASDGKRTVKGSIEYSAEFFPAAHLKGISFNEPVSDAITEVDEEDSFVEAASASQISLNESVSSVKPKEVKKDDPNEGIVIPREELIRTQSGILAFQLISGQLSKKGARLEVLFDDGYWPEYSSEPARSPHAVWDEIGEAFIRELDFSHIILKLNLAEKETREEILATKTIDMNEFLETCLDRPANFTLTDEFGGNVNTVTVACKYIPVDIKIEPRESINNSGFLRVDVLDAKDISAADRSGKSDPYAVFVLDGERVFKSSTQKKTLSPTWNENFEVEIASRVAADFVVEVYDWDRVGSATLLGRGPIDLAALEPLEQSELSVSLTDVKTSKHHGTVRIKMVFKPQFLAKSRASTSTLGFAGRAATRVGGTVVGGVVGVGGSVVGAGAHGVGKVGGAVGKGVFGVGKGVLRAAGGGRHASSSSGVPPVPEIPSSLAADGQAAPSPYSNGAGTASAVRLPTHGTLSIHVGALTGAEDPDEKKLISIRVNNKAVDSTSAVKGDPAVFNEQFSVRTGDGPTEIDLTLAHKKTFGSDKVLGSHAFELWSVIDPLAPSTTFQAPLGTGQVQVTLQWTASTSFPSSPNGNDADDRRSIAGSVTPSSRTKSRFSLHRHRGGSVEPSD